MIDPLSFKFIDAVPDEELENIIPEQAYAVELTKTTLFVHLALADIKDILPNNPNMTFMDHVYAFAQQGKDMTGSDYFFYNFKVGIQKEFKEKKAGDYLCFSTSFSRDGNNFYKDLSVDKLCLGDAPHYSDDHYNELLLDTEVTNEDFKAERRLIRLRKGSRNAVICDQGPANELMWKTTHYIKSAIKAQVSANPDDPNFLPLLWGKNGFTASSSNLHDTNYTYLPISQYLREPEALFNLKLFSDVVHDVALPCLEEVEETAKDLYRLRQRHCVRIGVL